MLSAFELSTASSYLAASCCLAAKLAEGRGPSRLKANRLRLSKNYFGVPVVPFETPVKKGAHFDVALGPVQEVHRIPACFSSRSLERTSQTDLKEGQGETRLLLSPKTNPKNIKGFTLSEVYPCPNRTGSLASFLKASLDIPGSETGSCPSTSKRSVLKCWVKSALLNPKVNRPKRSVLDPRAGPSHLAHGTKQHSWPGGVQGGADPNRTKHRVHSDAS